MRVYKGRHHYMYYIVCFWQRAPLNGRNGWRNVNCEHPNTGDGITVIVKFKLKCCLNNIYIQCILGITYV